MTKRTLFATIISLFFTGGPTAIFRRIVAVIVDAVNCKSFGARPHIGVEIVKVVPSITYFYAVAAVMYVTCAFWVIASFVHSAPDIVFRRMRHTVFKRPFYKRFNDATTARLRFTALEIVYAYRLSFAAIALNIDNFATTATRVFREYFAGYGQHTVSTINFHNLSILKPVMENNTNYGTP